MNTMQTTPSGMLNYPVPTDPTAGPLDLAKVNAERTWQLIPVMVYMSLLSFVGTIGNAFVVYLYSTKFKKATSAYFILWLAVLDFHVCAVGMPFEITDMVFIYTFTYALPCKLFRFFIFAVVYSSALTLIVVAFDRFIKVCYPLKGWNVKPLRTLAMTTVLGFVLAIPVGLVYGTATTPTHRPPLNGTECSITDDMHRTFWPVVYYTSLGLVFVISIISLTILYGKLVYSLYKRKKQMRKDVAWFAAGDRSTPARVKIRTDRSHTKNATDTTNDTNNAMTPGEDGYESDDEVTNTTLRRKRTKRMKKIIRERRRSNLTNYPGYFNIPTERTSIIFGCVSIGFIVSYLPSLIIIVTREIYKDIEQDFVKYPASDISYNIFLRSYFLNHAINPIIYGFLNPSFRRECRKIVCPCVKVQEQQTVPVESMSSSVPTSAT